MAFALAAAVAAPLSAQDARTTLPLDALQSGGAVQLVANSAYLPAEGHEAAATPFNGTLRLEAVEMQMEPALESREVMGQDAMIFPGVELQFFTHEGDLVPTTQAVITPDEDMSNGSFWQIIIQPGRVWSEEGDNGWSRASFPFALMNRLETDTHNGVASFAYKDGAVTDVRFQITQQTAPFYIPTHFQAWGALEAEYTPATPAEFDEARTSYATELEDRMPTAPWSELVAASPAGALDGFEGDTVPEFTVMHAAVKDGTLYYQPSETPQGPYPYPTEMRFGVWSVTKSVGPGVGMLRLAEKYGDWVFSLKLIDYIDIDPPHDGWEDVTFGDALNMATGLGGGTVQANPNSFSVDYSFAGAYDEWYRARSEAEKVKLLEKVGNYPWGPGHVARYRDRDMFSLGVAMDNFLKSVEGEDANIWTMIAEEVFEPIGIHHAPMNLTFEEDGKMGQPIMAWGWYPTLDDLAKVSGLLQAHGAHDGQQILHEGKTRSLFSIEGALEQGPSTELKYGALRYKMGHHYVPFKTSDSSETMWIPFMSGWIGNRVVLAPNGMTLIRISNAWPAPDEAAAAAEDPTPMMEAAHRLVPFDK
ncbi:hypothetical protein [Roseovarius sp. D0-M9]|uniref:hypothetical protein n=1 Tax=Roseovarius sp. D0-M9 TaxID=3127117 RepID=UPI00300FEF16